MSRTTFIILILVVILLIVGGFGYYFYFAKQKAIETGTEAPTLSSFFPFFGKTNTPPPGTTPVDTTVPPPVGIQNPDTLIRPRLEQVSTRMIAGATSLLAQRIMNEELGIMNENTSTSTTTITTNSTPTPSEFESIPAARYVERGTGHIYDTYLDTLAESRVSNTTIPRIEQALFGNGGESVILRYLQDDNQTIETFTGTLSGAITSADSQGVTTLKSLLGTFLPQNISDITISPDGKRIFYVSPGADGVIGTSANIDGTGKKQVFLSPFSEWLLAWPKQSMFTATTKASGIANGYLYSVDPVSGAFAKILGNVAGLTTNISPDGGTVLYAGSKQNGMSLALYDIASRTSVSLGLNTLPEKCVWNTANTVLYCGVPQTIPAGLYPDIWYQGLISFTDSLWKIDVATRATSVLINPFQALGNDIDLTAPYLDTTGRYLLFTNKKDSTLWRYDLGL